MPPVNTTACDLSRALGCFLTLMALRPVCVSDVATIVQAKANFGLSGMLTVDLVWQSASRNGPEKAGLVPEWHSRLSEIVDATIPLVKNGTVKAYFLGDEPGCHGVPGEHDRMQASFLSGHAILTSMALWRRLKHERRCEAHQDETSRGGYGCLDISQRLLARRA